MRIYLVLLLLLQPFYADLSLNNLRNEYSTLMFTEKGLLIKFGDSGDSVYFIDPSGNKIGQALDRTKPILIAFGKSLLVQSQHTSRTFSSRIHTQSFIICDGGINLASNPPKWESSFFRITKNPAIKGNWNITVEKMLALHSIKDAN